MTGVGRVKSDDLDVSVSRTSSWARSVVRGSRPEANVDVSGKRTLNVRVDRRRASRPPGATAQIGVRSNLRLSAKSAFARAPTSLQRRSCSEVHALRLLNCSRCGTATRACCARAYRFTACSPIISFISREYKSGR